MKRYRVIGFVVVLFGLAGLLGCTQPPPEPTEPRRYALGEILIGVDSGVRQISDQYTCPENMALIPGGEIRSEWVVENSSFVRRLGDPRQLKPYCMDRYEYPNKRFVLPRTRVSYVEARQLCKEAGKHLCTEDEWEFACAGPEGQPYVYGSERESWRCNTDGAKVGDFESIAPAGSHNGCFNRWGVFDLNGNVSEWVDAISFGREGGTAIVRGGTAWPAEYGQSCFSRHAHPIYEDHWADDGLRCCVEPGIPGIDNTPGPDETPDSPAE